MEFDKRGETPQHKLYVSFETKTNYVTVLFMLLFSICLPPYMKETTPLKLELLEWSERKFDFKPGSSMLKNSQCNFFEQSEQPVAVDSTLRFSLDDTCK